MELDLALNREGVTLQPSDHPDLLAESIWSRRLNQWIEAISNDAALACPGLVQEAEEVSLGLRFTDDTTIAELNNTWRQKTGPTHVLSFAALEEAKLDQLMCSLLPLLRRQKTGSAALAWNWETSWCLWTPPAAKRATTSTASSMSCAGSSAMDCCISWVGITPMR